MSKILVSLLCVCCFITAQAQVQYYGNGYTIVTSHDMMKSNDLETIVFKSITAKNVKGGLIQLLKGSGWQLADRINADPAIISLYEQPYPEQKRILNPVKLVNALEWIAGDAWDLVIDPVHKLVSFQLTKKYRCFNMQEASCNLSSN